MIKTKTAPLLVQSLYIVIGVVGVLASLGLFDGAFRNDFYLPFTHLSNYFCLVIMSCQLIYTVKARTFSPAITFMGLTAILLTFTVFYVILANAPGRDPSLNTRPVSILFHGVLPVLYVAHWVLFCKHGHIKWFHPLLSVLCPLLYVLFIFVHAALFAFDDTHVRLYPYFFLNPEKQGMTGILCWILTLLVFFLISGYLLFALDRKLAVFNKHQKGLPH